MAVKKQAFKMVEQAIIAAREKGITVHRGGGAIFDWTGPDKSKPLACDAIGAVLISMGYGASSYTYNGKTVNYGTGKVRAYGWTLQVQNHLGVGVFWLWCFFHGWDHGRHIQVAERNESGTIIGWRDEDVSKAANKLAKRFCD